MNEDPDRPSAEELDAAYGRANSHSADFVGLNALEATALASRLDLTLEFVPADSWHFGVNVSGRVTVFMRDGTVVSASS